MAYYISDDYLSHHGVKGMHWGVRKSRVTSARAPHSSGNAKKEKRDKSGSSSKTKKYIAIGAGLAVAGLATYRAMTASGKKDFGAGLKAAYGNTASGYFKQSINSGRKTQEVVERLKKSGPITATRYVRHLKKHSTPLPGFEIR